MNRRNFLKYGGVGAALSALPLSLQKVLAAGTPSGGSLSSVAHVVILSQENRSFDHYLGTLNGVRGYNDPHPLRLPDGSSVFAQKSAAGQAIWPFRLNSATTSGQCMVDVTHDWATGRQAFNSGAMDKWIPNKGNYGMAYYSRADIPFHYALSDAFTTCDHYFCSADTSTNPNRLFLMSGSNGAGLWANGASMNNDESKPFTWMTYAERLEAAGISWKMYQEADNYDDNALAWFANFKNAATTSNLYKRGMTRFARTQFAQDVANDTLPAVSWIIAPAALSEHPNHSPNGGGDYAKIFLDALASNPAVWAKTVFIYTYDENGGIFDHVVPPIPPAGTTNEWSGGYPLGLGHRIPTWLISPWSVGGWVHSQTSDHTSTLRFLERFTGVQEPNISAWRRSVCGDLMDGFDFVASGYGFPSTLPNTTNLASDAAFACANLPAAQPNGEVAAPNIENGGARPLRPVAVQPNVDASVDPATKKITLTLSNGGTQSAAFDIHGYGALTFAPVFATVGSSAQTHVFDASAVASGKFDLAVHGPNSFYRRFAGNVLPTAWQGGAYPQVSVTPNPAGGVVAITIQNRAPVAITVNVDDYLAGVRTPQTIAANASLTLNLATRSNWYDFMLLVGGDTGNVFVYEYCGHIEGGNSMTFPGRVAIPGVSPTPTPAPGPTPTPAPGAGFTAALLSGMTHYYRLENAGADDVGGSALSTVGPVAYGAGGKFGSALTLDAKQAAAAFLPFDMAKGPASFTLGFWVKMPAGMTTETSVMANKDWATGKNAGISIGTTSDGRFKFNIGDGTNRADGYIAMVTGAWVYVAIALDTASKKLVCYASNAAGTVSTTTVSYSNVTGNIVPSYNRWALNEDGRGDYYSRFPTERYVLAFDDLAVWNRALAASDIQAIASASQPIDSLRTTPTPAPSAWSSALLTGLAHYHRFDADGSDDVAASTATITGTATYPASQYGNGIRLDALQAAAAFLPYDVSATSNAFTMGLWVKMPSGMGTNMTSIVANKDWATGKNVGISIGGSGDGRFKFNVGDGTNRADGYLAMPLDTWCYVAICVDKSARTMRCYASQSATDVRETVLGFSNVTGNIVPSYGRWALNEDARGDYYSRYPVERFVLGFDDVAVWTRALSIDEIKAIAASGQPIASLRGGTQATVATMSLNAAVCAAPWAGATTYAAGESASYNGRNYRAKWVTQGEVPDRNSGSARPWEDLGAC
ncbi:phosphocholine-specific phospholipase C [Jeongeupia naejangsanensis]|uniref:phospholipase C n=1 Tax=Jeongeupia naejangsanensis TaxID=613195 RepID=A0ABS2BMR2_9NEIS|nr:phospholipase C, phosphocholine-specific [Jeongeupia naejangsanensis]MBM3116911.1 phospholipase C, phosphocholine-specific [Jeongeupia naejangsanensis]